MLPNRLKVFTSFVFVCVGLGVVSPAIAQVDMSLGRSKQSQVHNRSLEKSIVNGFYLELGARGQAVAELQQLLKTLGHSIGVDGDFGPNTLKALKAFQARQGLQVDGVVGPRTFRSLKSAKPTGKKQIANTPKKESRFTPVTETPTKTTRKLQDGAEDKLSKALGLKPIENKAGSKLDFNRPNAKTGLANVSAQAQKWAQQSKAAGNHTLVVAFEGLWSFSQGYADKVYAQQDAIRAGKKAKSPGSTSMSFVAKYLIAPNMARYSSVEYLLLPETAELKDSSVAEKTVLAWRKVHGSKLRVVIVGHSFGGYASLRLARKLEKHGIPVAAMLTADARTRPGNYDEFVKASNVKAAYNFYQKGLWLPGYPIKGATNQKVKGVSHGTIPNASEVVAQYRKIMSQG